MAVAIGLLVFVHELGHFLAAKWAKVRVEVFSFGFGPYLFSYKKGDTTYAFSAIPLGGYVRMTGQSDSGKVSEEEKVDPDSYLTKSPAKRSVIIVAGVVMNLIFAFFLFSAARMMGMPIYTPEAVNIIQGSPADKAGIKKGDIIVEVNGSPVDRFLSHRTLIATSPKDEAVEVKVKRGEEILSFMVKPVDFGSGREIGISIREEVKLRIGAKSVSRLGVNHLLKGSPAEVGGLKVCDIFKTVNGKPVGKLKDLKAELTRNGAEKAEIVVERAGEDITLSIAPRLAGLGLKASGDSSVKVTSNRKGELTFYDFQGVTFLQEGDSVETINGVVVNNISELLGIIGTDNDSNIVTFGIIRDDKSITLPVNVKLDKSMSEYRLGFVPGEKYVGEVTEGSIAEEIGLKKGDILYGITRRCGTDDVTLRWHTSGGEKKKAVITQYPAEGYTGHVFVGGMDARQIILKNSFFGALAGGIAECALSIEHTYRSLWGLLTNNVSPKQLSGPLGLVEMTYVSTERGWGYYLWFVAFISINLAVINILPLMPFDGGHLVFLGYEGLRGKPIEERIQDIAQIAGLVLVLLLFVFLMQNDISRMLSS